MSTLYMTARAQRSSNSREHKPETAPSSLRCPSAQLWVLRSTSGEPVSFGPGLATSRFFRAERYSVSGKPRPRISRGIFNPLNRGNFQPAQSDRFHAVRRFRHGRSHPAPFHHFAPGATRAKTSLVGRSPRLPCLRSVPIGAGFSLRQAERLFSKSLPEAQEMRTPRWSFRYPLAAATPLGIPLFACCGC